MTTPADNTPYAIITDAMIDSGKLKEGGTPSSSQLMQYMRRLNDMVNFEQTQGLKLWLNEDVTIPLVAGQTAYTLGPGGNVNMTKPLKPLQAYYLLTTNPAAETRRPLTLLSWNDWLILSPTNQPGAINSVFVDKQQTFLRANMWLTPDVTAATNGEVHVLLQTQVTNVISLTETMNFPIEWRMFLHWGLADELATGQPEAIMTRCSQRALMYREALEAFDVEDGPTSFAPDPRGQYSTANFQ